MTEEENKALNRRFVEEVINQGNIDAIDELIDPGVVDHAAPPGFPTGREGAKQFAAMMRAAFPDLHLTIEDMIAEGDKVAVRSTWSGTHEGEFMGIPATGRRVAVSGIDISRCADGRMVEHWEQFDALGLMQQLGAVSPPDQAGAS
ncbi:MAG: ester cyclase [Actinomycetota bacterium]|nr:ester cyclase [Actinomycetota bacterium]